MDFSQYHFEAMYPQMGYGQRLPFYMAWPMQNAFAQEEECERDMMRLQEMYPREAREIMEYAADICDRMEYEGSMMFDEYPDRLMLRRFCKNIYRSMTKAEELPTENELKTDSLYQMIQVLLCHEIHRRRCRYRRCRRWY